MNFSGLFLLIIILIAGVLSIAVVANGVGTTPYVDSNGATTSNQTNISQQQIGNFSAPAVTVGTGAIVVVVIVLIVVIAGVLALAINPGTHTRSRY